MSDHRKEGLLGRWSRLKRESAAGNEGDGLMPVREKTELTADGGEKSATVGAAGESASADVMPDRNDARPAADALPELPSLEELDPESDFKAFMDPRVDDEMRRAALKTLFRNPDFNVTDGLDVYAEDYTKLEKLTPAMVAALRYAQRTLFGKDDEQKVEHGQANDVPTQLASNDADNEQLKNSETESEQPLPETLHTQSNKN